MKRVVKNIPRIPFTPIPFARTSVAALSLFTLAPNPQPLNWLCIFGKINISLAELKMKTKTKSENKKNQHSREKRAKEK